MSGWTTLGPMGVPAKPYAGILSGQLFVAVDPHDAQRLLATSARGGGIFRSRDGGANWQQVDARLIGADGLPTANFRDPWIDPTRPEIMLVAGNTEGIYRSTDGGLTWATVKRVASPRQFTRVGASVFVGTASGILESRDAGTTWAPSLDHQAAIVPIAAFGSEALAGGQDGSVYRFAKGKWTVVSHVHGAVRGLAIDPRAASTVYAIVSAGGYASRLHASLDGGVTWKELEWPKGLLGPQTIAFGANQAHRLYVGYDGAAWWLAADGNPSPVYQKATPRGDIKSLLTFPNAAGTDDRCVLGTDQGISIAEECSNPKGPLSFLGNGLSIYFDVSFALSPDGRTIIASATDHNGMASFDGGKTWATMGGYEDGAVAINPYQPSQCLYHSAAALSVSTDGCATFHGVKGFPKKTGFGAHFAFDPTSPSTVYIVDVPGSTIQRSTDGGTSFAPLPWTFKALNQIIVSPKNDRRILVESDGLFSVSTDGGTTWTTSTGAPKNAGAGMVAFEPNDDQVVVSTVTHGGNLEVYRSTNGGKSFVKAGTVVAAPAWHGDTARVYVGDARRPGVVVVTRVGAYLSSDLGDHWTRLDTAWPSHDFTDAKWLNHHLYLANAGRGILRSNQPLE